MQHSYSALTKPPSNLNIGSALNPLNHFTESLKKWLLRFVLQSLILAYENQANISHRVGVQCYLFRDGAASPVSNQSTDFPNSRLIASSTAAHGSFLTALTPAPEADTAEGNS